MIEGKELLEFATEMIKVLNEKSEKYEKDNNYSDITEEWILKNIENQLEKYIRLPVWKRNEAEYAEYKKRRLTHIANFCFLLWYKLQEELEKDGR